MKSKTQVAAGLLVIAGIVGAVIYAGADAGPALLVTHQQEHEQQAARSVRSGDQFNCHSHGTTTYHCH